MCVHQSTITIIIITTFIACVTNMADVIVIIFSQTCGCYQTFLNVARCIYRMRYSARQFTSLLLYTVLQLPYM